MIDPEDWRDLVFQKHTHVDECCRLVNLGTILGDRIN